MPSDKYCCVPGCKDSGSMHAVLHGFPKHETDRVRFNTWLYAIGGDILGLENAHICRYRRVCHLHFEEKYFCRNNRINNLAVPTLYLPGLNQVSQPTLPFVGRKPLQGLVNQSVPTISTVPEPQQLMHLSTNIVENIMHKEDIERITPSNNAAEDEFDSFGKYIASSLRSMPPEFSINAKTELQKIISEIQLKIVRQMNAGGHHSNRLPYSPYGSSSSDCENQQTESIYSMSNYSCLTNNR